MVLNMSGDLNATTQDVIDISINNASERAGELGLDPENPCPDLEIEE